MFDVVLGAVCCLLLMMRRMTNKFLLFLMFWMFFGLNLNGIIIDTGIYALKMLSQLFSFALFFSCGLNFPLSLAIIV